MSWKALPHNMDERLSGNVAGIPSPESTCRALVSVVRQFYDTARSWHCDESVTSPADGGIDAIALHLHAMNFDLWHHEDAVRRPDVRDHEVAIRKRCIDDLNSRRNAAIEDVDGTLLDRFGPDRNHSAKWHTETPGMIVDRLSVLALRILHTDESAQAPSPRRTVLEEQYDDLLHGLEQLLSRVQDGEIRFKLYRQFKSARQRSYCPLFEQSAVGVYDELIQVDTRRVI